MVFGNDRFVALAHLPEVILTSQDGVTWDTHLPPQAFSTLDYIDRIFVARGSAIFTSENGESWIERASPRSSSLTSFAFGSGIFVAVGNGIMRSKDGTNWTTVVAQEVLSLSEVIYGNGQFVAWGRTPGYAGFPAAGTILTSTNGIAWTFRRAAAGESYLGIVYGNGNFVVPMETYSVPVGDFLYRGVLTSHDAIHWNPNPLPGSPYLHPITFANGTFVAFSEGTNFYTSADGFTWTNRPLNGRYYVSSLAFGKDTLVAVGQFGTIVQSEPFSSSPAPDPPLLSITSHAGLTITGLPGRSYRIDCANDLQPLTIWQALTNLTLSGAPYRWINPNPMVPPKQFYRAVLLP